MNRVEISTHDNTSYRITGAKILNRHDAQTLTVHNGRIESIGDSNSPGEDNNRSYIEIDATGSLLIPGFLDLYSRCREPGLTRKGTIASESAAALAAGFTHVLCTPDTTPVVDNVATVELITHRSQQVHTGATVLPMAALTTGLEGKQLSELRTLQSAGCPVATNADYPIESTNVLYSAMQYASSFEMPVLLTARDAQLGIDGCAHSGATATQLGLPTIPVASETVALSRLIELCRDTQCQLHVSRISSARAVQYVERAKQAGLPVTCDVGIHHLFFTDELLAGYDSGFHSAVPFRSKEDRKALRNGLKNGVIDAICTDHAPHDVDAGLAPFPETEPGLSAYDWFIPLLLQVPGVADMSLEQVLSKVHDAPYDILNMKRICNFEVNDLASFFILDTQASIQPHDRALLSAGHNHPLTTHDATQIGLLPLHGKVKAAFHNNCVRR